MQKKRVSSNTINLHSKAELILSSSLLSQIDYFHKKNPGVEWSGVLFYKILEGSISDINSLVLLAERMYLMNIGSSGYTSFEYSDKILDFYDTYPEHEECFTGLIHTHHSMESYFSSTDMEELEDNAPLYNFYLSLIVNNKHDYAAKLAIPVVENQVIQKIKDENGELIDFNSQNPKVIYTTDLKVYPDVDQFDVDRQLAVNKEKTTYQKPKYVWQGYDQKLYNNKNNFKPNNTYVSKPILSKKDSLELKVERYLLDSFKVYDTQVSLDQVAASIRGKSKDFIEDYVFNSTTNLQFGLAENFSSEDYVNIYGIWWEAEGQINELDLKHKKFKDIALNCLSTVFQPEINNEIGFDI